MHIDAFIATHRASWDRLRELAAMRQSQMTPSQLDEFMALSERAASQLSHARFRYDDPALTSELTDVVARANATLYRRSSSPAANVRLFFTHTFPGAVWHIRRPLMVAILAFVVPALVMGLWVSGSSQALDLTADEATRAAYVGEDFENYYSSDPASEFTTAVLINNIQVSFLAYALGVAFCVGSLYVLMINGMALGVAWALFIDAGNQGRFFGLIIPHGLLELSAVVIAGAAGISMGWALINPGDRTRSVAFTSEARRSVSVVLGLMLAFAVAGLIEGYVTPGLPLVPRVTIGVVVFVAFWTYLIVFGRSADATDDDQTRAGVLSL